MAITKGSAFSGLLFILTNANDHAPMDGQAANAGTIKISLDGGAFASIANQTVTEVGGSMNGLGWYTINLAASETNANNIAIVIPGSAGVVDAHHIHLFTS